MFWSKVPDSLVKGSLWENLDDTPFDAKQLESEFGLVTNTVPKSSTNQIARPKPKFVQLVDGKREQNCSIALARFRMTNAALCVAILNFDETILTSEKYEIVYFHKNSNVLVEFKFCRD